MIRGDPPELFRIGDEVDLGDAVAGDGDADDADGAVAGGDDQAGGAVDDRRLGQARRRRALGTARFWHRRGGGFMLLGGRAADLLGRRPVLVAGTSLFTLSSPTGAVAQSAGMLVGARLAQGIGAAMMLPAALSLLTTTFAEGKDRNTALGVWGGVAGLASAAGVLLGGVLSEGPGWRSVLLVNLPVCALALGSIFRLIGDDRRRPQLAAGSPRLVP